MHHEYIISSVRVFNSIPKLQLMFFLLIAINMQISSSINSLTILAENNSKKKQSPLKVVSSNSSQCMNVCMNGWECCVFEQSVDWNVYRKASLFIIQPGVKNNKFFMKGSKKRFFKATKL